MHPLPISIFGMRASLVTLLGLAPLSLLAADYDDANQPAYQDGWQKLDDGSTEPDGLGGWVFDELSVADGDNIGIDSQSATFKLHDSRGGYVELYRFFDPNGLQINETFSIEISMNGEAGYQGIDLRDGNNQTIFNFNGGKGGFSVNKTDSGNGAVNVSDVSRVVFQLEFCQRGNDGGSWSIRERGKTGVLARGKYAGIARSIRLYGGDQKRDASGAMFFNRLEIQ